AWLGAETAVDDGRLVVTRVPRGTPAWQAGLSPEDEILAIDGYRVPPRGLEERLQALRPGRGSTLLVARRERLVELPVTFSEKPEETWKLEPDPEATAEQRARLAAWLTGPETLDAE
ncbi:MAG TPA: PDZ domain-containing protein, partial [Thermoanaerobaculia bacterium]|nr:PDZ domain-containing protein [Thermoanaerobaculia bacterium]